MAAVRIVGIVAPPGPAFAQSRRGDGRWDRPSLVVFLRPWREAGGTVRHDQLGVRRPTRLPYELWSLLLPPRRAVALTVDIERDEGPGRATLLRYRGWRRDRVLADARRQWLAGRQLSDPIFGDFAFDERIRTFEARADWCGAKVNLSIPGNDEGAAEGLEIAHRLFRDQARWDRRFRKAIAAELLPRLKDQWPEGESPLDAEAMFDRIALESIAVDGPELVSVYYDDAELFGSHAIEVQLWLEEDRLEIDLAG